MRRGLRETQGVCIACSAILSNWSGPIRTADRRVGMPKRFASSSRRSPASAPRWPLAAATIACRSAFAVLFHRITEGSMMHDMCPCGTPKAAPST